MKIAPTLSAAAIRALSRELASRLNNAEAGVLQAHPGRLFFPKRTHELSLVDGDAPDGLSADYLALAARLNNSSGRVDIPDVLAVFRRTVEAEITRARIVEARLIEAMDRSV